MPKKVPRVVVFGELMLRLDAAGFNRFVQAENFTARYTGAEANVAVGLSRLGIPAAVVSRVPEHELGQACIDALRRYGVDTEFVLRGGERLGVLYVETGHSQRPSRIIYDRAHSAFSTLKPAEFHWPEILGSAGWLHLSGTAPALGAGPRAAQAAALRFARKHRVKVSYDCNYRSLLWSVAAARRVLPGLIEGIDLFLGTPHDAKTLFGIRGDPASCAQSLREKFSIRHVAFTLREGEHFNVNRLQCLLAGPDGVHQSREYEIHIVDRIGAGDAFAAGMIHSLINGRAGAEAVEFAAAACCLKQSIPGDFALVSAAEVEELAATGNSGRIRR